MKQHILASIILVASATNVAATENQVFTGSLTLEQNYLQKRLPMSGKDWADIYPVAELDLRVRFTKSFSARGVIAGEPLRSVTSGKSRIYGGLDVRAKDVYLEYAEDDIGFQLGRITAPFGAAWYLAPGLDATALAEDYVIWDRAGLKGWKTLNTNNFGKLTAEAAVFMLDTGILSRSARNFWTQKRTANGGLSNTKYPRSLAISLSGNSTPVLQGLGWNIGVERQALDRRSDDQTASKKNQHGVVFGINFAHKAKEKLNFFTVAEVAAFDNRKGVPDRNAAFLTLGEKISYGKYRLELTATGERFWNDSSMVNRNNFLASVTLGYDFTEDLKFDLGYRVVGNQGSPEKYVRGLLSYTVGF